MSCLQIFAALQTTTTFRGSSHPPSPTHLDEVLNEFHNYYIVEPSLASYQQIILKIVLKRDIIYLYTFL